MVQQLYLTQAFLLLASILLGFFLFQSFAEFMSLWNVSFYSIFFIGGGTALLVIAADLLLVKFVPEHMLDDGGINEKLFRSQSVPSIIFLTALIAVTEELLFRGIIQTHFGLFTASIIFALLHFRYITKWVLFIMVVGVSFLLGIVFEATGSLLTTIFAHFIIDLVFALQIRISYKHRGDKG
nr:CPBP family intramembrane glutamic endopeptidase [Metabacillus lacus]